MRKDTCRIPHVEKCIESLGRTSMISTYHTNVGHRQVEVAKNDCSEPAFASAYKLNRFSGMPFRMETPKDVLTSDVHITFDCAFQLTDESLYE